MEYISYNMGTWDFPDIYARALGPAALRLGHIYQACVVGVSLLEQLLLLYEHCVRNCR